MQSERQESQGRLLRVGKPKIEAQVVEAVQAAMSEQEKGSMKEVQSSLQTQIAGHVGRAVRAALKNYDVRGKGLKKEPKSQDRPAKAERVAPAAEQPPVSKATKRSRQGHQQDREASDQGEYEATPEWFHKGDYHLNWMLVKPVVNGWHHALFATDLSRLREDPRYLKNDSCAIFSPSKVKNWAGACYAGLNVVRKSIIFGSRRSDFYRVVCIHCNRSSRICTQAYHEVFRRGPRRLIVCRSCLNEYKLIERQKTNCPTTGSPKTHSRKFSPNMLSHDSQKALQRFGFLDDITFKAVSIEKEGKLDLYNKCDATHHLHHTRVEKKSTLERATGSVPRTTFHVNAWHPFNRLLDSSMFSMSSWDKYATEINEMIACYNLAYLRRHPPSKQINQSENYGPDFNDDVQIQDVEATAVPPTVNGVGCRDRPLAAPTLPPAGLEQAA